MQNAFKKRFNSVVKPKSVLFNLGDLTLKGPKYFTSVRDILDHFNGEKHLVVGNHDQWQTWKYIDLGFSSVHTSFVFEHDGYRFYLAHDPAIYTAIENDAKAVLLCGHVHNLFQSLLPEKRVVNVGVDVWDYKPVPFTEILFMLNKHNI